MSRRKDIAASGLFGDSVHARNPDPLEDPGYYSPERAAMRAGRGVSFTGTSTLTKAIRTLRAELCARPARGCACHIEGTDYADGPWITPCVQHQAVNVQLDILDELARRLSLDLAEVTAANEPGLPRDRDGNRGMFTGWPQLVT
jgi:hypothetical protein